MGMTHTGGGYRGYNSHWGTVSWAWLLSRTDLLVSHFVQPAHVYSRV